MDFGNFTRSNYFLTQSLIAVNRLRIVTAESEAKIGQQPKSEGSEEGDKPAADAVRPERPGLHDLFRLSKGGVILSGENALVSAPFPQALLNRLVPPESVLKPRMVRETKKAV